MARFLRINDIVTKGQVEAVVIGVNPTLDCVDLYILSTKQAEQYSLRELRKELACGERTLTAAETVKGIANTGKNSCAAVRTFQFRTAVVKKLKAMVAQGKTLREAIHGLKGKEIELATGEKELMCSEREAYRLLKLAENGYAALMPAYGTRGNRQPRYGERMLEIILQHVESHYAVPLSKISVKKFAELVNQVAIEEGVLPIGKKVSRKFVRLQLVNNWNPDLDTNRLDKRVAKSQKAVAGNRIRPGAPLNRVEMDALHLPMLAIGEFGIAEDLWILIAIDCDTSLPLSWWFMLTRPTTEDTFQCLERALYPKAVLLKERGINFAVDPYGGMLNLVMDNGPENSRHRLGSVAEVGINPHWTPSNSGNLKPFIERLNKSLKEALEALPGCTRFDGVDGARTAQAREDHLCTVKELEHWIVRWLFERWPHTPLERFITAEYEINEGLGRTPVERWMTYESRFALPLPPPIEKWRRITYSTIPSRKLSAKTGVSFEGFDFKGDNLKKLIGQYGPDADVEVHYKLRDYRTVYVPDKHTGEWIVLTNAEVTPDTPALSFEEAKRRRKKIKDDYIPHPAAVAFDYDLNKQILEEGKGRRTKGNKQKIVQQTHDITRLAEAVKRKQSNPLLVAESPTQTMTAYIADDAIPSFKTHHKPPRAT